MCVSLDHYVPRKWGGKNGEPNMMLAHSVCNSQREKLFPETMIFTDVEILRLTNPSQVVDGMSKKARKAMKHRMRVDIKALKVSLHAPAGAFHPDMPMEKR